MKTAAAGAQSLAFINSGRPGQMSVLIVRKTHSTSAECRRKLSTDGFF